jgi:hypothetical protein
MLEGREVMGLIRKSLHVVTSGAVSPSSIVAAAPVLVLVALLAACSSSSSTPAAKSVHMSSPVRASAAASQPVMLTFVQANAKSESVLRSDGYTPIRDATEYEMLSNGFYQGGAIGSSLNGVSSGTQYEEVFIVCCGSAPDLARAVGSVSPAGVVVRVSGDVVRVTGNAGQMYQLATTSETYPSAPPALSSSSATGTDPTPGSSSGLVCVTVDGYFPGGLSGHKDSSGFCVPDKK